MSCCKNINLDEAFAYKTAAQIKIKDRRLGITRVVLLCFAFIYVIVYNIVINKGWAKKLSVRGVAKVTGNNPTISGINGETSCHCYGGPRSTLCGNHTCHDSYSNFTDLPYCTDSTSPYMVGKLEMEQRPCIRIDSVDLISDDGFSTFLSTEIRYIYQRFNNEVMNLPTERIVKKLGKMWKETKHPDIQNFFDIGFYTSDIEKYTILLKHDIHDQDEDIQLTSLPFGKGILRSKNKAYCRKLYGKEQGEIFKKIYELKTDKGIYYCDIHPKKTYDCKCCKTKRSEEEECRYDLYEMGELLLAATVQPDATATLISPLDMEIRKNSNQPLRHNGFILELFITYTNELEYDSISIGNLTYSYSVNLLKGPSNTRSETRQTWKGTRYVVTKNGISIRTIVDGSLYIFDPQTLLVQMTSILGLTSIIALTIEMVMLKYLNVSGYYSSIKYSESFEYNRLKTLCSHGNKNLQNLSKQEIISEIEMERNLSKGKNKNKNSWNHVANDGGRV
jgi:hypothetical protein